MSKCGNQYCKNGLEEIAILLDTPEEIRVLAQHFPNRKPHIAYQMWPCRYCNPIWYAKFKTQYEDSALRRSADSGKP